MITLTEHLYDRLGNSVNESGNMIMVGVDKGGKVHIFFNLNNKECSDAWGEHDLKIGKSIRSNTGINSIELGDRGWIYIKSIGSDPTKVKKEVLNTIKKFAKNPIFDNQDIVWTLELGAREDLIKLSADELWSKIVDYVEQSDNKVIFDARNHEILAKGDFEVEIHEGL